MLLNLIGQSFQAIFRQMCKNLLDDLEESMLDLFLITFEHVIKNGW